MNEVMATLQWNYGVFNLQLLYCSADLTLIVQIENRTSNIHNAIKFTDSIAYDAYVDIFYGWLLFHQGRFVFVSKNILLVKC